MPSHCAAGEAATPAAQIKVRLSMRSPSSTAPQSSQRLTAMPSRNSTPSRVSARAATPERRGGKLGKSRGPASISTMRAVVGSMWRKSRASAAFANSARAPASSTPVGPAAHDDEGQQAAAFLRVVAVLGALEGEQDAAAHRRCILDRLQPRGDRGPFVVPEIGFAGAGGNDQLVVWDAPLAEQYRTPRHVDARYGPEQHLSIGLASQDAADRRRDVRGRQGRGRDLVQQRLK